MIIEQPKLRPPFITLFSEPGMGKTTLAAMFPKAIIIRTEDGIESVPVERQPALLPMARTIDQVDEQIDWIVDNRATHKKRTIIVDSITQYDAMAEKYIVDTDPNMPLSINQACGGFGAGVKAVGKMHAALRQKLERANRAGFAVIILAHATTDTVEPPDGDNYSRYTLRLGKHSQAPWIDNVDMVGFICLQKVVRGAVEDKKISKPGKAQSDGTRQLICHAVSGNVSKNRYHVEDAIELPPISKWVNPLFAIIPYYIQFLNPDGTPKKPGEAVVKKEEPTPEPDPEPETQEPDVETFEQEDVDPNDYAEPDL